jgi:CRISPR/Cas system CSM-associated protein Csm2 small subunit
MRTRLIEIYHADDNDRGVKFTQFVEALLGYFGQTVPRDEFGQVIVEKGIDYLSRFLSYRPSSSKYYTPSPNFDDVLNYIRHGDLPDILVVDMRWEFENKAAKNNAGKDLIEEVTRRNEEIEVFTNTAYGREVLKHIVEVALSMKIDTIKDNPTKDDFKDIFPQTFHRIANKYIQRADTKEKNALISLAGNVQNDDLILDEIIQVNGEKWKVKNLFLCCWNPDTKKYEGVLQCLKDFIIPDITCAFSECFGVEGVKQITHNAGNYFSTDRTLLQAKIKEQTDKLDQVLLDVKTSYPEIYNAVEVHIKSFEEFKDILSRSSNFTFDENLQKIRERHFQFKGLKTLNGLTEILHELKGKNELTCFSLQEPSYEFCEDSASGKEFEINIPIYKIFEKQFNNFFKRIFPNVSKKGACAKDAEFFSCTSFIETYKTNDFNDLELYENLLVIRHAGDKTLNPTSWDKRSDEPDWLQDYQNVMPFLGRLHLFTRKSAANDFYVFDCTQFPIQSFGDFKNWHSSQKNKFLECMMGKDASNTIYYVFSFLAWRQ